VSAAAALSRAILAALRADAHLRARLGGDRVFDAAPARPAPPYLFLGPHTTRDWSTSSGAGHEHRITLTAVAREEGFAAVQAIAGAVAARLDAPLAPLAGHHLVLLRVDAVEHRRLREESRAVITLTALTEVL